MAGGFRRCAINLRSARIAEGERPNFFVKRLNHDRGKGYAVRNEPRNFGAALVTIRMSHCVLVLACRCQRFNRARSGTKRTLSTITSYRTMSGFFLAEARNGTVFPGARSVTIVV